MFKYYLITLCFCWSLFALTYGADTLAQAKCRSLHATDVDANATAYSNNKCLLICSIHGKLMPHNMSEGLPCPGLLGTTNVCRNGLCVAPVKLGYIDIEMTSATLVNKAMAYADVCIQNGTTTVSLPVANRTSCVSCKTKTVSPTTSPMWSAVCTGSHNFVWVDNSRVTFEVWDQVTSTSTKFAGGASLLVSQVVANGDNHKPVSLALANGNNAGKITFRITWTPK